MSASIFLVALETISFWAGTILAFFSGGGWSKIPTSLSSLELSLALEISFSSSELSSLDESELDESELLPSDFGLLPAIFRNIRNYSDIPFCNKIICIFSDVGV